MFSIQLYLYFYILQTFKFCQHDHFNKKKSLKQLIYPFLDYVF